MCALWAISNSSSTHLVRNQLKDHEVYRYQLDLIQVLISGYDSGFHGWSKVPYFEPSILSYDSAGCHCSEEPALQKAN